MTKPVRRMPRPQKPPNLPEAVWDCLMQHYSPSVRPGLLRSIAQRMAAIHPRVWDLPIDWRISALALHRAADVQSLRRRPSSVSNSSGQGSHDRIVSHLRAAAGLLEREEEVDMDLCCALEIARDFYGYEDELARVPLGPVRREGGGLRSVSFRASRLLRMVADVYEGKHARVYGLHPEVGPGLRAAPATIGRKGQAVVALAQVTALFEALTGHPHRTEAQCVVDAYYPA